MSRCNGGLGRGADCIHTLLGAAYLHAYTLTLTAILLQSQAWEVAKKRQDAQLERIERGVGNLGDMARGMQVRARC